MKPAEILQRLQERFPGHGFELDLMRNPNCIIIEQGMVPELLEFMRDDAELQMDTFDFSTCVDHPPDRIDFIYSLSSLEKNHRVQLKVMLDRYNPSLPTVSHLWRNAEWNEREIYDLFGVFFPGHKDLRRLMMPEDWEGHPLLKDYAHPNLVKRPD
jgi:NADH-quinone oxidoreductase subunit C